MVLNGRHLVLLKAATADPIEIDQLIGGLTDEGAYVSVVSNLSLAWDFDAIVLPSGITLEEEDLHVIRAVHDAGKTVLADGYMVEQLSDLGLIRSLF